MRSEDEPIKNAVHRLTTMDGVLLGGTTMAGKKGGPEESTLVSGSDIDSPRELDSELVSSSSMSSSPYSMYGSLESSGNSSPRGSDSGSVRFNYEEERSFEELMSRLPTDAKSDDKLRRYRVRQDINRWVEGLDEGRRELVDELIKDFIRRRIERYLDDIPNSSALRNSFFDGVWQNSRETIDFDAVRTALINYRVLTNLTRPAVATTILAVQGFLGEEKALSQNLMEEAQGHIQLLDDCINAVLTVVKGIKDFEVNLDLSKISIKEPDSSFSSSIANSDREAAELSSEVTESTKVACKTTQELYTGKNVDGAGISGRLLIGEHDLVVVSSVIATHCTHEGKAPFMLANLLRGIVCLIGKVPAYEGEVDQTACINKFYDDLFGEGIIEKVRRYFDEHLGKKYVNLVLQGHDICGLIIQEIESIKIANAQMGTLPTEALRDEGEVEIAHAIDARDAIFKILFSGKQLDSESCSVGEDRLFAYISRFVAAKQGICAFLEMQGDFWNGLATHVQGIIDKRSINHSPENSVPRPGIVRERAESEDGRIIGRFTSSVEKQRGSVGGTELPKRRWSLPLVGNDDDGSHVKNLSSRSDDQSGDVNVRKIK